MAEKRMFAKSIVLSDSFLDMPMSARCLYFTFGMLADDDGFVNSPKSIMRQCGASDDDLSILLGKKYLIPFDTGVVVIKHWRINNYLRSDRYRQTNYLTEKSLLSVEDNGAYSMQKKIVPTKKAKPTLAERKPVNDLEKVEKEYLLNYKALYESGLLKLSEPVINWAASRKLTKDCIERYGLEAVLEAVRKSRESDFCIEKGYSLTTILSAGVFAGLVNGTDVRGCAVRKTGNDNVPESQLDDIVF